MSLQLPAILSPPTSCIPALALTVSCRRSGCRSRLAPSRVGFRFWASPFPSRLANASGRIVFNMVLFMDWQFVSGCSPPRLSTTQLPSTTDSQCSVRWGLSPHCWCALSGALGRVAPRPTGHRCAITFVRPQKMNAHKSPVGVFFRRGCNSVLDLAVAKQRALPRLGGASRGCHGWSATLPRASNATVHR
jgi:hypothetical protein